MFGQPGSRDAPSPLNDEKPQESPLFQPAAAEIDQVRSSIDSGTDPHGDQSQRAPAPGVTREDRRLLARPSAWLA